MRGSRALYAAAVLNLADFLASGPLTSAKLAATSGANATTVRRFMRALVAHSVFEKETRTVSVSILSERGYPGVV
jgi:DNA-binding IclR family transcriptional regulator